MKSLGRSEISASFLWEIRGAEELVSRCNNLANRKMKFWCLQKCCKCPEKLFGLCRNAANAAKNFLAFAGTLQVPRKTFWRLQERCKCLEKLFGVCRNAASASKNFLEFAGTLQVPRKTFWALQNCCKHFQKRRGRRKALRMYV